MRGTTVIRKFRALRFGSIVSNPRNPKSREAKVRRWRWLLAFSGNQSRYEPLLPPRCLPHSIPFNLIVVSMRLDPVWPRDGVLQVPDRIRRALLRICRLEMLISVSDWAPMDFLLCCWWMEAWRFCHLCSIGDR